MISYEWIVEQIDASGEIVDTDGYPSAVEAIRAMRRPLPTGDAYDFGLTRSVGDNDVGLTGRSWAYVADGKLPERATDGDANGAIPARYHAELAAARRIA